MKRVSNATCYHSDRMVSRWKFPDGSIASQGKRVPKDFPLTPEERKAYVKGGSARCVKVIKDSRKMFLSEAFHLLQSALKA